MSPERVTVTVEGHEITLSNLEKVLYSATGFTKGEMLDYYANVAPVMLPHLRDRPLTVKRFPDGVETKGFIEKNLPRHAPAWIGTVELPRKGSGRETTTFPLANGVAELIWFVNMAAVEFHTPMWRVDLRRRPKHPDMIVFDLDPGAPATIVECCEVAALLQARLAKDGIELLPKTSGAKGLQLYGRVAGHRFGGDGVNEYAHHVARSVEQQAPDLVVSLMKRSLREKRVLIDWSQNSPAKTTVTPYSLRAVGRPSVSTPVSWHEVEACARSGEGERLRFAPQEVIARVEKDGDLFAPLAG